MQTLDFCEGWRYYEAGKRNGAKSVDIPHDAMLYEKRTESSGGGRNIGWFEALDYVYEKTFFVPQEYKDKIVFLEFEGVYKDAEVFINGNLAAYRPYGYTNFYVSAEKFLKFGDNNLIEVKVKNSDQPNSRWYSGTGIYRPVKIHVLESEHILFNGLKIRTLEYDCPKIEVKINTSGGGNVRIEVLDGGQILVAREVKTETGIAHTEFELSEAIPWSVNTPKLYICRAHYKNDIQESTFGIRKIECDSKNGLRLNGEKTILYGACIHHDNGFLGAAAYGFAEERKVRILKENGFNAIRSAHNPCSKAMLDACDRLGMLVMDEYVDMWYIPKTKYDYSRKLGEFWKQDLTDMVDKAYNHPSVIMYSTGNEVSETAGQKGIDFCGEMTDFLKTLDDRPVTCGINIFFNFLSRLGLGFYSDKKADKAAGKNKYKTVGSEFFNTLANKFGNTAMKFGAALRGSDLSTRGAFARMDIAGYNYGITRYKKDAKKYPDRVLLGTETFCTDAFLFDKLTKQIPALIGDFVWAGFDYIGEVGIGSWEYKTYAKEFNRGVGWLTAGSGRFDITGKPLMEAEYMKVAYGHKKIVLGVVPADNALDKHSPSAWKMTNALPSWSFNGCEGKTTFAEVYTKAYRAELYLNGKKIGSKQNNKNGRIVFKVKYYPGELTAKAYDNNGKLDAETSLFSAADETKLTITSENAMIKSDGLCYVRLSYTDNNGVLKPLMRGDINVSVSGGELLALGNACPYNEKGYVMSDITDTYYGEAMAIIKPLQESKNVKITAESGLGSGIAEVSVENK